jgi:hypothetical protein
MRDTITITAQNLSSALIIRIGINPEIHSFCFISTNNRGVIVKRARQRRDSIPSKRKETV